MNKLFYIVASILAGVLFLTLTCYAESAPAYIDVTLSPSTLLGDVYVDGALAASQVLTAHLAVTPGAPHLVEVKNIVTAAPGFGDVFVYGEASRANVIVGEGRTYSLTLWPLINYQKGYLSFSCDTRQWAAGQSVACQARIGESALGVVNPGETVQWTIPIGSHTVHVDLVGEQAGLWAPPASDHPIAIQGGQTTYLRAAYDRKGQLTISPNVAGIVGDVYVDDQLIAAQVANATLFVAPGNHTVAGRNWSDPAANGVYRYADATSTAWVGANQTQAVALYPPKEYLLGFGQVACGITAVQPGQDARCNVTIDGQGLGVIEAGQQQSYNLTPGAHAVNVSVVGSNADLWAPAAQDAPLTIWAGGANRLVATFNRKGQLSISPNVAGVVGDLYVDGQLIAAQVANAALFVAPGNHTVAGRNWSDPAANGVYRYADATSTAWVGANQTQAVALYPPKEYLLGFGQISCAITAVQPGQDARCNVTIDGQGLGVIEAGQQQTYNLTPGAHAVNVSVVGGNADLWAPAAQDASLTIWAGNTNRLAATFNRKGQLTISPNVAGIVGDVYVDDQLIAAQVANATLFVAPGNHTVAGRNWSDPAANGVYRYADATSTAWVGANQTRAVVLYPSKEYLLGFGQVACAITAVQPGQDARCNVTIDGQGMGIIEAGQQQTYNLATGAHTVNVNVVGNNASLWTPATQSGSLSIAAARTSRFAATFNRPAPTPVPISVSPRPAQVARGSFELGGHITSFDYADKMHYAGMTWAKVQVHYGDDASGIVAEAHAHNFRIQLSALGSPDMVTKSDFAAKFSAWVAQLAASGADAIEVWNEPNIDREWQKGHIGPANYTQLLCASYSAIKQANANTLVISAAPSPTGFFGGCSADGCDDNYWVAGLRDAGATRCMDYVGAHHNAGATSPSARSGHMAGTHYSWYFLPQTELYYRTLRKQLFYTEMGYVSQDGYCQIPSNFGWGAATTPAQQAQWLAEAASLSARTGMVRVLIVWNVNFTRYDCGPEPGDPQAGYAIIRPNGSCPACEALHAVLGTR